MASNYQPNRVKITIDVSDDERTYIKMLALKNKMTISEYIMSFLRPSIPSSTPNSETEEAMRDVEEGKGLSRHNSIEKFWEDMGLDPDA